MHCEWIKTEERYPHTTRRVLGFSERYGYVLCFYSNYKWHDIFTYGEYTDIYHWQELPTPPKPEEE